MVPSYSPSSFSSWIAAPGRQGAILSRLSMVFQACWMGAPTVNTLLIFIEPPPEESLSHVLRLRSLTHHLIVAHGPAHLFQTLQVLPRVNVRGVSHPFTWYLDHQLRMPPQNRPRPLIPGQLGFEQRPHLPREQNRIAPLPSVGGDCYLRSLRKSLHESLPGLSTDVRLVPEQDHRGPRLLTTRPQPGEDRSGLAPLPLFVIYSPDIVPFAHLPQPFGVRADDDDDLLDRRVAQVIENRRYERPLPELGEQLPAPEPAPGPGGQHDRRHAGVILAHRALYPPAAASALVSAAAAWIGPELAARRPPECPVLSATISAAIAIAVSSGVRAPISRPMGLLMRASCSSVTPSSFRRAVRLSCVLRLPIAPM